MSDTTKAPLRVIVSGTRDGLSDEGILRDRMMQLPLGTVIVEGGARGVDRQARGMAERLAHLHFSVETHHADWGAHGRAAGPIRNQKMLDLGADLVLAYPGPNSRGTWDMIRRAENAGVKVEVHRVE